MCITMIMTNAKFVGTRKSVFDVKITAENNGRHFVHTPPADNAMKRTVICNIVIIKK